jgi:hypothetical protein
MKPIVEFYKATRAEFLLPKMGDSANKDARVSMMGFTESSVLSIFFLIIMKYFLYCRKSSEDKKNRFSLFLIR